MEKPGGPKGRAAALKPEKANQSWI